MVKKNKSHKGLPSIRQLKVANEIKQALASILYENVLHDKIHSASMTFTDVVVTADLRLVKVFVATRVVSQAREITKILSKLTYKIRPLLLKKVYLKYAPEIVFYEDLDGNEKAKKALELEALLENLGEDREDSEL
jgi:ribosome-binding factor A